MLSTRRGSLKAGIMSRWPPLPVREEGSSIVELCGLGLGVGRLRGVLEVAENSASP
jgi:hypothetical protein